MPLSLISGFNWNQVSRPLRVELFSLSITAYRVINLYDLPRLACVQNFRICSTRWIFTTSNITSTLSQEIKHYFQVAHLHYLYWVKACNFNRQSPSQHGQTYFYVSGRTIIGYLMAVYSANDWHFVQWFQLSSSLSSDMKNLR